MATLTRGFESNGDRYEYDFRRCTSADGWAQLDTKQDASYYGNWINPLSLKLMSYCEGDTTLTECQDEADFIATVRESVAWHSQSGYFLGIDCGISNPAIIEAFQRLGLSEFLQ